MTDLHNARRRSISILKNRALTVATALMVALIVLPGKPASADHFGGPVILTGIDAEDCGPGTSYGDSFAHGPINSWIGVVQNGILNNATNGGDGILVIGAHISRFGQTGLYDFWNAIAAATGETVTFGDENSDFAGHQMVTVVGSEGNTCGGLTRAQNTVLAARATDFAAFVNGGGGLFASDQSFMPGPYGFVAGLGAVATTGSGYDDIDPTDAGLAVGVNDSLDVPRWHITFTKFPDFLKPLAYQVGTQKVAALGGQRVIFPVTPGGEPPVHPPPPPPPPPQPPGLLDGVFALVNPEPSSTPSPTPPPPPAHVGVAAPAAGNTTPPADEPTGPVPIGGVKAGGGGTASGSDSRTAAILLVLLAAVAHVVVLIRRKAEVGVKDGDS